MFVAAKAAARKTARHASRRTLATATSKLPPQTESPSFPCVDAHAARQSRWLQRSPDPPVLLTSGSSSSSSTGPEPPYARPSPTSYQLFHHTTPLALTYGSTLPSFSIAYETWGTLSPSKDNAVLLHTGLSASSHAAATRLNSSEGWWQKFIGPNKALDTNKYFIICTNVLGGCYGSTGPSSPNPLSSNDEPYGTNFPILSIFDMIRGQFHLLDHLGIQQLYASVGCSMGGMQSLAAAYLQPQRVGKIASISGTAKSSPSAIAMRYAQRSVLMADPNWNKGFYYDKIPPHTGMKLARQIATITYRSGPEWEQRFGRQLRPIPQNTSDPTQSNGIRIPALCPDFLIETYLDHQGEQFCLKYDANSLIYISKAMDLFDMTHTALSNLNLTPHVDNSSQQPQSPLKDLVEGLYPLRNIPTLVLGIQSDILFPVEQQKELAAALRATGNKEVSYYELGGVWGHDTFLLDVQNVGGALRGFLDSR